MYQDYEHMHQLGPLMDTIGADSMPEALMRLGVEEDGEPLANGYQPVKNASGPCGYVRVRSEI
jgi:hypothetical protein